MEQNFLFRNGTLEFTLLRLELIISYLLWLNDCMVVAW